MSRPISPPYFLPNGHVLPLLAAAMAVANVSGFLRQVFLVLVAVLIVKFARDTLVPFP